MDTVPHHAQEGNTPLKYCATCPEGQQWHPATTKFFARDKNGFSNRCKACKKAYNKTYYSEHQKQILAQKKEYSLRPENRGRKQAYNTAYYLENREYLLAQKKEYYQRPEIHDRTLAQVKVYRRRPEVREHGRLRYYNPQRKQWMQTYRNRPDVQERRRERERRVYATKPEIQEHRRFYRNRPEVRERLRINAQRPEARARARQSQRIYKSSPEAQERIRVYKRGYNKAYKHFRRAREVGAPGHYTSSQIQELLKRQRYRCYYAACGHAKFKKTKGKYDYHIDHTFPLSRVIGSGIPANDISYLVLACPACNLSKNNKFPWEWPEGGRLL